MNLKEILNANNVKQADLARYLSLPTSQISNYANNKFEPSFEILCKIADFLHVSTDELLGRNTNLVNLASLSDIQQNVVQGVLKLNDTQLQAVLQVIKALDSNN